MRFVYFLAFALLLACVRAGTREMAPAQHITPSATHWLAAESETAARQLAAQQHATFVGPVPHLDGFFLVRETAAARIEDDHPSIFRLTEGQRVHRGLYVAGPRDALLPTVTTHTDAPNPLRPNQWNLDKILVDNAWTHTRGAGVLIHVVDEGVQPSHPELSRLENQLGYSVYSNSNDATAPIGATHGTSAASVAAGADNTACGIGVAPDAHLAATLLLGELAINDAHEASALARLASNMTVQSNSWGPEDNGRYVVMPGPLARAAMLQQFRAGGIMVWAAGNGAESEDNVALDGYAGGPHVIAVGATDEYDAPTYYTEPGSAVLVAAPSSSETRGIVAATGTNGCTLGFGGTSAAAPQVAGVVALMRATKPGLTFADTVEILAQTARMPLEADTITTGAGLRWSKHMGFGVVNANAAVNAAAVRNVHKTLRAYSVPLSPRKNVHMTTDMAQPAAVATVASTAKVFSVVVHLGLELGRCRLGRDVTGIMLISPDGTHVPLLSGGRVVSHSADLQFTVRAVLGENANGAWSVYVAHRCAGGVTLASNERTRLDVYEAV